MQQAGTALSICGHSKHGKSTLVGRLLAESGAISAEEITRIWEDAPAQVREFERWRGDFNKYNLLLLRRQLETAIDPSRTAYATRAAIKLGSHEITILDQPGHWRYMANLVQGFYLADMAVIVIDAKEGITRSTTDLFAIINALKIPLAAVCVTKMDLVAYREEIFRELEEDIIFEAQNSGFVRRCPIIPISALAEEGLGGSGRLKWYSNGPLLHEVLEASFKGLEESEPTPVRFALTKHYSRRGLGVVLTGILESGRLSTGNELIAQPAASRDKGGLVTIKELLAPSAVGADVLPRQEFSHASARTIVDVVLRGTTKDEAKALFVHGGILGPPEDPPKVAKSFIAELVFLRDERISGSRTFNLRAPGKVRAVAKLVRVRANGKEFTDLAEKGEELEVSEGSIAVAYVETEEFIPIDNEPRRAWLCRFVFVDRNAVIAVGRCSELLS